MALQGSERALPVHAPDTAWRLSVLAGVVATGLIVFNGAIVEQTLAGPFFALAGLTVVVVLVRQTIVLRDLMRIEREKARLVEALESRISELGRVQAQVVASSRRAAVGELSAAVAHEVNNPLQVILGYAEILLYEAPAAGSPREELEIIRSEALRVRSIVQSLTEFARPQQPDHLPADLVELAEASLDPVAAPERLALEGVSIAV